MFSDKHRTTVLSKKIFHSRVPDSSKVEHFIDRMSDPSCRRSEWPSLRDLQGHGVSPAARPWATRDFNDANGQPTLICLQLKFLVQWGNPIIIFLTRTDLVPCKVETTCSLSVSQARARNVPVRQTLCEMARASGNPQPFTTLNPVSAKPWQLSKCNTWTTT